MQKQCHNKGNGESATRLKSRQIGAQQAEPLAILIECGAS
jgi:hypothetical protein